MSTDLDGACCSEEAARLLPWYVAGRLSAADFERVSHHLQRCAICQNDIAEQHAIRALLKAPDGRVEYGPQAGLAKTLARIDELGRDSPPADSAGVPLAAARRMSAVPWLTAAVLVQALALGYLGAAWRHPASGGAPVPGYATLSTNAPAASEPHIRAVFSSAMTLGDLKALLASNNLMVVRGPSAAGAYTLASSDEHIAPAQVATVVATLRSDNRVLFAEPAVNDAITP